MELIFPKPSYQQMFEAFNLTQVFTVSDTILERLFFPVIYLFTFAYGWKSTQSFAGMESQVASEPNSSFAQFTSSL